MTTPTNDRPPTERALLAWWDAKRAELGDGARLTCHDCGRVDSPAYVQPQHPYYADGRQDIARCADCVAAINARHRAERRAQLAARPHDCARCGARPHTWRLAGLPLCGRCATATRREHAAALARAGALALFADGGLMVDTSAWAMRQRPLGS